MRCFAFLAAWAIFTSSASAVVIQANTTSNNGGSPGWGILFDLNGTALVTHMTTASSAVAGSPFTIEFFIRTGSALGGPVGSGPGSSSAGWTSIGTANAVQGPTNSGVSELIDIPNILVQGSTVGVIAVFSGAGPRYFGTGSPPLQTFGDANLTITTGDARTVPFTGTGSFFSSRGLTGTLVYEAVPEPSVLSAMGIAGLLVARRRR
jgi:hypothetical protein